jgi:tetratricopeptide (TPR) repeat protein
MSDKKIDFFISYTNSDLPWAEWIDFQLRQAGYSTIVQFANFGAGRNFINEMHTALRDAKKVLGILSPRYLDSPFAAVEWMAALRDDPLGEKQRLTFVRIEECTLSGLLPSIVYIDLVGLAEKQAQEKFLREIKGDVPVRKSVPHFPAPTFSLPTYPPSFPRFWHMPIRRKPLFIGRDKLIEEIVAGLSSNDAQVLQTLTGIGGTGKTRAAIEYCYRQIGHYDAIWWIDGSDDRLIHQGLTRLARELSTVNEDELLNPDELRVRVEAGLRDIHWLLIFDNVESPETILGHLPHSPRGHILVTSRNPLWSEVGRVVEVPPLEREHSINFLVARSGDNDLKAATALCEQLGDLPIALEQAGAYIERTGCGIESYATRFSNRRRQRMRFEDETERVIASVWRISIQRILYEDPIAFVLSRVLSFFGPHRIPLQFFQTNPVSLPLKLRFLLKMLFGSVRFFLRIFDKTSDLKYRTLGKTYSLETALESLRRYALIEINQRDISLHPLVRSVIQSNVRPRFRQTIIELCAATLSTALEDSYRIDEATKLWCLHVLDLSKSAEELALASEDLIKILLKAAELSAAASEEKISEAPEINRRALSLARALPIKKKQRWEVPCLLKLAAAYREADRFPEATRHLSEAINLILDMEAPKRYLIIFALSEYGELLRLDYQTSYASRFFEAAISLERGEDPHSLSLVGLLGNYAEILRNAGEYEEAESVALEALSIATDLLGPDNVVVAGLKYRLGVIQSCKGDVTAARRNLEMAFSVTQDALGDESPQLNSVERELQSLEQLEIRQFAAKFCQTPRVELESDEIWNRDAFDPIGEVLQFIFEKARDIALDNLHKLSFPAILRSGLPCHSTINDQPKALHLLIGESSADSEDIGQVLSPLIVPIYRAIADDPRWLELEEPLSLFRDEVLTQYSVAFRSRMVFQLEDIEVGAKSLRKLNAHSASFEEWINFFEKNAQDFYQLIPGCIIKFERGLLDGSMHGTRRGIYGVALQYDARFYLDRLLEKAQTS